MNGGKPIPAVHRVILEAAVRAVCGEQAVIRDAAEAPGAPTLRVRADALQYGIRTFWSHWTGRNRRRGPGTGDEAED